MSEAVLIGQGGIPAMSVFKNAIFSTSGMGEDKPLKFKMPENPTLRTFSWDGKEYARWGDNNRFPEDALDIIGRTGVLSTSINLKARCCHGQGVLPSIVTGLDETLNDIYKPVNELEILSYLRGYSFRNYHLSAFRDLIKFGNCFPLLIPNQDGDKIVRVDILNARHCRLSKDKTKLLVFAGFENAMPREGYTSVYDVLSEEDPFYDLTLKTIINENKLTKPIAFPRIRNYFSNNDYYALPDWWTSYESGWVDIANQIPKFLKAAYKNAITCMWHVQVPTQFYKKMFPLEQYDKNEDLRTKAILDWQTKIDASLTCVENANKAMFSTFEMNESGKAEEKIEFVKLDTKMDVDEKLSTSAAANSEILFSMMLHPSVLGAGMPGGPYSGSSGSGSDIRESFLVNLILAYVEKMQVLDPIELMLKFNGKGDIELKYRNITLVTLDKGKSTNEKIT